MEPGSRETHGDRSRLRPEEDVLAGVVSQARALGLLMGVSFRDPNGGKDWWISRGVRSAMLRNGAYPICDNEEVTVRMYPALNMEESVLREALEIMEDAIVHVSEHGHAEGDYPTYPTGDYGA